MLHGKIEIAELCRSWVLPAFRHWWKVWDGSTIYDIYFDSDDAKIVKVGDKVYLVDPTKGLIRDGKIDIYPVSSAS